jgi:hypothetical protein
VLGALLVVLVLFLMLLRSVFDGGDEQGAGAPSPSPSFGISLTPEPEPSAAPGASANPSAAASPEASQPASPGPSAAPCADASLSVAVRTAKASAPVGEGMGLTMTVTNTGTTTCTRDVGAGANELKVTSGDVLVWSSDFCNASSATDLQQLEPGEAWSTSLAWPGTVVDKTCPTAAPVAQPGSYRAFARNGGLESEAAPFTVR